MLYLVNALARLVVVTITIALVLAISIGTGLFCAWLLLIWRPAWVSGAVFVPLVILTSVSHFVVWAYLSKSDLRWMREKLFARTVSGYKGGSGELSEGTKIRAAEECRL